MPLAISGHIHEIRNPNEKFSFHVVELSSPFVEPDENGGSEKARPSDRAQETRYYLNISIQKKSTYFLGSGKLVSVKKMGVDLTALKNGFLENIEIYIDHKDHFIEC